MRRKNYLLVFKYIVFLSVFLVFFFNQLEVLISGQGDVRNYRYLIEIKIIGSQITEPFLKFLIILVNYFTDSATTILLIINTINFLLIIYLSQLFIKKDITKEILLILMMGLSVALLSALQTTMRQGIGYVFFFYFIYSIINHHKLYFSIIIILLASLCHNIFFILGGIIIILNYLDIYKNISKKFILIFLIFILFAIFSFFVNDFLIYFQKIFLRQTYVTAEYSSNYNVGIRFDFILTNIIVIIFIVYLKNFDLKEINHFDKIFLNLLLSSIIANILFREFPYIDRFFYASWIFYPIILTKYIENKLLFFISFIFVLLNYLYIPNRYEFYLFNIL